MGVIAVFQRSTPLPFVVRTCPFVPPNIVTLLTEFKLLVPVTAKLPLMLAPVPVTTKILAFPATEVVTFPPEVAMFTLDVPLEIEAPPPPPDTVVQLSPPLPFVVRTCPFVPPNIITLLTLLRLLVPTTTKLAFTNKSPWLMVDPVLIHAVCVLL